MATFDHSRPSAHLWKGGLVGRNSRRWSIEFLQATAVVVDVVLAIGSALLAADVYQGYFPADMSDLLVSVSVLAALLLVGYMALRGAYRIAHLSEARHQAVWVLQGWVFVFFNLAWIAFLLRSTEAFSRGTVSLWFVIGGFLLFAAHGFGAKMLARAYVEGRIAHSRVAVVAIAEEVGAIRIVERLAREGIEIASVSLISPSEQSAAAAEEAGRGVAVDVRTALADRRLDGIFVFGSWNDRRRIEELKAVLSPVPVPMHLFADHEMERMLRRPQVHVGDLIGLELQRAPLTRLDRALKRMLDIVVALFGLVLLAPLMGLTALAVVAESGFPVLFRQHRKGFGARPFSILKFRSMTVRENGDDVVQASRRDVRVTRVGRMIRRTSIDELPQLFNVLKGDMSIVGPRPHAVAHDDYYDGLIASYALRQHVKPGITGWAQVKGLRGETRDVEQMRARVEHDLWYINNWSIWLDIRIILLTALKVFFDENAY
jgi:Undecaprenyl-phosphate glucose phosphotransferase